MPFKLIISPDISRTIGSLRLGREALVKLLVAARQELEVNAHHHRQRRDPERPDLYFWCGFTVWDQGRPRGFRFTLDDTQAEGHLFVIAVDEF